MTHGSRLLSTSLLRGAALVAALSWHLPARAANWIGQVEADITCTAFADDAERQSLQAPVLIRSMDRQRTVDYFRNAPVSERHARFRHLLVLGAIGWWADRVNDQRLRANVYLAIAKLAEQYAVQEGSLLFRQIVRCVHARMIPVLTELESTEGLGAWSAGLASAYGGGLPANAVEDWPLILALRELRIGPGAEGRAMLADLAVERAGLAMAAQQPARASRLLAAAAWSFQSLDRRKEAIELAGQAMSLSGKPPDPVTLWQVMPVLYDAFAPVEGARAAHTLRRAIPDPVPPHGLNDQVAKFEMLYRLSAAAELIEEYDSASALGRQALRTLMDLASLEPPSISFYRHALRALAARDDPGLIETVARRERGLAEEWLKAYGNSYAALLERVQSDFVSDARVQLINQHKAEGLLNGFFALYPVMDAERGEIEDTTFRLAQLHSYGRLTHANLLAELAKSSLHGESRPDVERFFKASTRSSSVLRHLFGKAMPRDGELPSTEALWDAFFLMDVLLNETGHSLEKFVDFVRRKAPNVAALITPQPAQLLQVQRLLKPGEALVATLVTPADLYVWGITPAAVKVSRVRIADREISAKVRRLRAGLTASSSGGVPSLPPFDAAAAHELYTLIFEPLTEVLADVQHVLWYGHGALGSVPPALLVTAPPPGASLDSPADFGATRFLVDRHAFSALADLSLFSWHRRQAGRPTFAKAFLGIGAPMLSPEEVAAGPRARSYELAGAFDQAALAELPRLPESADELKALAAIMGEANSALWLGAQASEARLAREDLQGFQVIAFATHGFLQGEVGTWEPSLMLAPASAGDAGSDGLLSATEIAGLKLDSELVILSACNTAGPDGRPGAETFSGLTQAFFTAGARSLMVSHWPVMSGAAVQLSIATVQESRGGNLPLSVSLQRAMQAARESGQDHIIESHPAYWGPFVVVGDGSVSLGSN